jgi:hypothetical protein
MFLPQLEGELVEAVVGLNKISAGLFYGILSMPTRIEKKCILFTILAKMQNFAKICYFTKFHFRENEKNCAKIFQRCSFSQKIVRKSPKSVSSRENNSNFFRKKMLSFRAHLLLSYTSFRQQFLDNQYSRENLPKSHAIKIFLHKWSICFTCC